ncbi:MULTISPECIES: EpsG family protein [Sphingomonas]|uniref:EpsG family protein n=1 Tax=Sphingomonas TaxID=13687 RepID=UPI000DEFD6DA|nr:MULTISPECIES: EpsG family protein [Sphingomonas]
MDEPRAASYSRLALTPYLLLFAFFALGALFSEPVVAAADGRPAAEPSPPAPHHIPLMLIVGGLLMAVMIGLRFRVGGDWDTYTSYWDYAATASLAEMLDFGDPAYQFLNWGGQQLGLDIWSVNLVCGLLFSLGLIRFARTQPLPWLVVVVAIPYLVVVVAMGYTRQAVAIGLLLGGMASLFRGGSLLRFAVYVVLAALFHKTAVLALPLIIFSRKRNRLLTLLGGLLLFYALYAALLADNVDKLVTNYIQAEYQSSGAAIRVGLSLIPALLFLASPGRFAFDDLQRGFFRLSSWVTIALLVALVTTPSSTAVDRMALYMFPLQLAVMSRLPLAFPNIANRFVIVCYALAIELVWLDFADFAYKWLPYRTYLL